MAPVLAGHQTPRQGLRTAEVGGSNPLTSTGQRALLSGGPSFRRICPAARTRTCFIAISRLSGQPTIGTLPRRARPDSGLHSRALGWWARSLPSGLGGESCKHRLALRVLEQTGLRVGELERLESGDLDFAEARLRVRHGNTKAARQWVACPEWLMDEIGTTLSPDDRTSEAKCSPARPGRCSGWRCGTRARTPGSRAIPHTRSGIPKPR